MKGRVRFRRQEAPSECEKSECVSSTPPASSPSSPSRRSRTLAMSTVISFIFCAGLIHLNCRPWMSGFADRRAIFSLTVNDAVDRVLPPRFDPVAFLDVDAVCRSDRNVGGSFAPILEAIEAKSKKVEKVVLVDVFSGSSAATNSLSCAQE